MMSPKTRTEAAFREYLKTVQGLIAIQMLISRDIGTQTVPRIEIQASLNVTDGFGNVDTHEKTATLNIQVFTAQNVTGQSAVEDIIFAVAAAMDDLDALRDAINAPTPPDPDTRTITGIMIYTVELEDEGESEQSQETNTQGLSYNVLMRDDDGTGIDPSENLYVQDNYIDNYFE
jgi:hypothetical protein